MNTSPQAQLRQDPVDPMDSLASYIRVMRSSEATLLNKIAARVMSNLLYIRGKSGTSKGELGAEEMVLFWEGMDWAIRLIRLSQPGPETYAHDRATRQGLAAVHDAILRNGPK